MTEDGRRMTEDRREIPTAERETVRRLSSVVRPLIAVALLVGAAPDLNADPIADFYRGKTLRMFIGYGPGGGYDLYARLAAEFLPRHIPGNPAILPQNMPGAGSFVAAKYMADVAPKDGTAFGSLAQTLALDSVVGSSTKLDAAKFRYIGRLTTNIDNGAAVIIYQAALKRHRLLANVPTLPELAVSEEARAILRAVAGTSEIGRSIITTPDVPEQRLAALRKAFQAMLKDADFLAACEKRNIMVDAGTGEEMDAIVRETLRLSPSIVAKIGEILSSSN